MTDQELISKTWQAFGLTCKWNPPQNHIVRASTLLESEMMVWEFFIIWCVFFFFFFITIVLKLTLIRVKTISHDGLNLKFNKTKNTGKFCNNTDDQHNSFESLWTIWKVASITPKLQIVKFVSLSITISYGHLFGIKRAMSSKWCGLFFSTYSYRLTNKEFLNIKPTLSWKGSQRAQYLPEITNLFQTNDLLVGGFL